MNRFTLALHILIGKPLALTDAIQLIYRTEDYRQRKDLIDPNLVSVRPYTRRHKSTRAGNHHAPLVKWAARTGII